jgi:hypothetical protein
LYAVVQTGALPPHTFAVPPPAHVCGDVHVPQLATVRIVPQLSAAITCPQFLPRRVQNAAFVSAGHAHTFAVPPPAHVCGIVHVPQLATVRIVPQLSAAITCPQFLPRRVQNAAFVSAAQPHTLAVPPPAHVCGIVHVPQLATVRIVPQLSAAITCPQFLPRRVQNAAFDSAGQPHTLTVPAPPHVCGIVHVPQFAVRVAPQLSLADTMPQFLPTRMQNAVFDSATQFGPHTFATPPPMHVCGAVHMPQFITLRIMPQLSGPMNCPHALPSRMQNAVSDSGVHGVPHTLAVPAPPQVIGVLHVPQLATIRIAPQLSTPVTTPHVLWRRSQKATSDSATQLSFGPASTGAPPALPPTPPTPPPPDAPVVDPPPDPPVGPDPDIAPVVSVVPPEPPELVPAVTPGSDPAAPVGLNPPPPELASRPGSAPSTPCAHADNASAAITSA